MLIKAGGIPISKLTPIILKLNYNINNPITGDIDLGIAWANPEDHNGQFMIGNTPINFSKTWCLWWPNARNILINSQYIVQGFRLLTATDFQPRSSYDLSGGYNWSDVTYIRAPYLGIPTELQDKCFYIFDDSPSLMAYCLKPDYSYLQSEPIYDLDNKIEINFYGVDSSGMDLADCKWVYTTSSAHCVNGIYESLLIMETTPAGGSNARFLNGVRGEVKFSPNVNASLNLPSPIQIVLT